MVKVTFQYDEPTHKWEVFADGVESHTEAREAFSAVVITCQELKSDLLQHTFVNKIESEGSTWYRIVPAV